MSKLQMIKRSNGSRVYSANFPLEMIEELGWAKGCELSVKIGKVRVGESSIIFSKEDELNKEERIDDTEI